MRTDELTNNDKELIDIIRGNENPAAALSLAIALLQYVKSEFPTGTPQNKIPIYEETDTAAIIKEALNQNKQ